MSPIHTVVRIRSLLLFIAEQYPTARIHHVLFIHSPGDGHLDCFQFLVGRNTAAVDIYVFIWTYVFIFLGQITKSGIAESYGNSVFHLFKETTKLFQSDTIFYSTSYLQQYVKDPVAPHFCQHLLLSFFLIVVFKIGGKG